MRMSEDTTNRDMAPLERVDWDAEAAAFDDEPDHGLRDPAVRGAWAARLRDWLPDHPCELLDLGCGTGSMSLLATDQGHSVTAVDLSPAMVDLARAKLAGRAARVLVGDAAAPPQRAGPSTPSLCGTSRGRCPTSTAPSHTGSRCCGPAGG